MELFKTWLFNQSWSEIFDIALLNRACLLSFLDVTPPSVQNCPASIVDRSNSLQQAVTWTPPAFTDNVGVVSVQSTRDPGFMMDTYTSLTVRYTALDAAGNVVYCIFNITLEGSTTFLLKKKFLFTSYTYAKRWIITVYVTESAICRIMTQRSWHHLIYLGVVKLLNSYLWIRHF